MRGNCVIQLKKQNSFYEVNSEDKWEPEVLSRGS